MTWIRLDDQFLAHPKIVGLSNDQLALWLAGIAYSNQQRTDGGVIPAVAVARLLAPSRMVDPEKLTPWWPPAYGPQPGWVRHS